MLGFEQESEEWKDKAACRGADSSLFFKDLSGHWDYSDALQYCAKCEVTEECLDYALRIDARHGVWGGLAGRSLDRVRKQQRAAS